MSLDRLAPQSLGPYELLESLATGGMAEVYLARRTGPHGFQKFFAVKRILPQLAEDADFVGMFVDEARISAQMSHPNIVHVFDFGEEQGELYMALEYVHGTSCAKLLRSAKASVRGEGLTPEVALHITISVLRALEYAHSLTDDRGRPLQLVHRDVSPGNVLLHESGGVKLADFGIARATPIERRTDVGQLKGKLGYMSPEQVVGAPLDHRSDLFTLGIVLAELLMKRPLFAGAAELDVLTRIGEADLSTLDAFTGIPDDLREVLHVAMAKKPDDRFANARAFLDALDRVINAHQWFVDPQAQAELLRELELVPSHPGERAASERLSQAPSTRRSAVSTMPDAREAAEGALSERWRLQQGGQVIGPLPYPALVELFATGKILPGALVSRGGGEFLPPHRFPELSRFITSPALKWTEAMPEGTIDHSRIQRQQLPSRVFYLASRRETGALLLQDGERRKRVYFVRGVPEYVASTEKSELLGESLIRKNRILRMELDMAVAMLPKFGGRLGDALVGLGVLRPADLFRAIHEQLEDRLVELFSWQGGEVAFMPGVRSQEESLPFNVDPYPLIARGIREYYTEEDLRQILEFGQVLPVRPLAVRVTSFRLEPLEERILLAVDAPMAVSELIGRFARVATPAQVYRTVLFGLSCEVLEATGFEPFTSTRRR